MHSIWPTKLLRLLHFVIFVSAFDAAIQRVSCKRASEILFRYLDLPYFILEKELLAKISTSKETNQFKHVFKSLDIFFLGDLCKIPERFLVEHFPSDPSNSAIQQISFGDLSALIRHQCHRAMEIFWCHFPNFESPEIGYKITLIATYRNFASSFNTTASFSISKCILQTRKMTKYLLAQLLLPKFHLCFKCLMSLKRLWMRFSLPCNNSFRYL